MNASCTSAFLAAMALSAATFAVAQTTPPSNNSVNPTPPSSAPSVQDNGMDNSSKTGGTSAANDQKMKACMASEKAKASGKSEDQLKQTCMMQIASHQGK